MEFTIEKTLPAKIEFNYQEIKTELAEKLTSYSQLVVTEDSIKSAKDDKAKLNTIKNAVDRARIDSKKEYLKPFETFESQCKELASMVDSVVVSIDKQLKIFDMEKINKKKSNLVEYYNEIIGDLSPIVSFEKIINPKWANAGEKEDSLKLEMKLKIEKIKTELVTIESLYSEFENLLKDMYLNTFNISAVLVEKLRLETRKKQLVEEKQKRESESHSIQCPSFSPSFEKSSCEKIASPLIRETECLKTIKVIFHDTPTAFRNEMKLLTKKYNITYGGIE